MTDTQLRRLIAGRAIRPYALAVSLVTAVIAVATFPSSLPGTQVTAPV